jgi:hypothetical protein
MSEKSVHVVPSGDQWKVERAGTETGAATYDTQEEAIAAGTELAQQAQVEILIHGRDGQIRARNSFGHDPRNVRG